MHIRIYTEDSYGKPFFKRLIQRLKESNKAPKNLAIECTHLLAPCNPKLKRLIRADMMDFDKVIVIADGDNHPKTKEKEIKGHVPRKFRKNIKIIVFKYEIEEWICRSLGIAYRSKPSAALKRLKNYFKRDLPKCVEKLDLERLDKEATFQEFLKAIKD